MLAGKLSEKFHSIIKEPQTTFRFVDTNLGWVNLEESYSLMMTILFVKIEIILAPPHDDGIRKVGIKYKTFWVHFKISLSCIFY